jgi:hypothetical protein
MVYNPGKSVRFVNPNESVKFDAAMEEDILAWNRAPDRFLLKSSWTLILMKFGWPPI